MPSEYMDDDYREPEPSISPDLWEKYLDARYPLRIVKQKVGVERFYSPKFQENLNRQAQFEFGQNIHSLPVENISRNEENYSGFLHFMGEQLEVLRSFDEPHWQIAKSADYARLVARSNAEVETRRQEAMER